MHMPPSSTLPSSRTSRSWPCTVQLPQRPEGRQAAHVQTCAGRLNVRSLITVCSIDVVFAGFRLKFDLLAELVHRIEENFSKKKPFQAVFDRFGAFVDNNQCCAIISGIFQSMKVEIIKFCLKFDLSKTEENHWYGQHIAMSFA